MAQQKQYFRIEGDAVHLLTERVERTVRLGDLMGEVAKESGIMTPILPLGCRFFWSRGDRSVFVIEQTPAVRQVDWYGMDRGNTKWKLGFPYVVFVVIFHGQAVSTSECRIFYRTQPLGNGDDKVLRTNLCNCYANGSICTGDFRVNGETLAQKAESFVTSFWKSQFNTDIDSESWRPAAQRFSQVSSLQRWQEETEKNPLFPIGISWFEYGRLQDVIEGRC